MSRLPDEEARRGSNEEAWVARARDVADFVTRNGRLPSNGSPEPGERTLGYWLVRQRQGAVRGINAFTPARAAVLDELVPGWRTPSRIGSPAAERARRERFEAGVGQIREFVAHYGRWPAQGAPDRAEIRLVGWLNSLRALHRHGRLDPRRRAYLDDVLPGWDDVVGSHDPQVRERAWRSRADELAAFVAEHGRLPRRNRAELAERNLSTWLVNQQQHRARLTPQRRSYLDQAVPGWADSVGLWAREWYARADEVEAFVAAHGRLPRYKSTQTAERKSGVWLESQRASLRAASARLTPQRRSYLDQAVPGWADGVGSYSPLAREQAWYAHADEVEAFVAAHGRLPRCTCPDPAEARPGRWLSGQRRLHRDTPGALDQRRRERLDAVAPGWTDPTVGRRATKG